MHVVIMLTTIATYIPLHRLSVKVQQCTMLPSVNVRQICRVLVNIIICSKPCTVSDSTKYLYLHVC